MKIKIFLFFFALLNLSANTYSQTSIQNKLLGNWKLELHEPYESFLVSQIVQNQVANDDELWNWLVKFREEDQMNFFTKDSLIMTVVDKKEYKQIKTTWLFNETDSILSYLDTYSSIPTRLKVSEVTENKLIFDFKVPNMDYPMKIIYRKNID
ncbi:hypothetical protein [Algoriphagus limi]|uniref:Lipocalin-like domain-containing protein n=1 Tax=Algoriphagus limi TaxID=2975273 RepID=A0ABT2G9L8_9BACT|nr:hypothetical protein [Algoriphagus limi]MCS5491968.1 hypothetical protein [Algoriphagus limi]